MAHYGMHTPADAFKLVEEDLQIMADILTDHYFNYKLEAVNSLRDYTSLVLGDMQVLTGVQEGTHHESPSEMGTTKRVLEAIEVDIAMIRHISTAYLDDFWWRNTVKSLRERTVGVLYVMAEKSTIRTEPESTPASEEEKSSEHHFNISMERMMIGDTNQIHGGPLDQQGRSPQPCPTLELDPVNIHRSSIMTASVKGISNPDPINVSCGQPAKKARINNRLQNQMKMKRRGNWTDYFTVIHQQSQMAQDRMNSAPEIGMQGPVKKSMLPSTLGDGKKIQANHARSAADHNQVINKAGTDERHGTGILSDNPQSYRSGTGVSMIVNLNNDPVQTSQGIVTTSGNLPRNSGLGMNVSDSDGSCPMDLDYYTESIVTAPMMPELGSVASLRRAQDKIGDRLVLPVGELEVQATNNSIQEETIHKGSSSQKRLLSLESGDDVQDPVKKRTKITPSTLAKAQHVDRNPKASRAVSRNTIPPFRQDKPKPVMWKPSLKKMQMFPKFKNARFIIFFSDMEKSGLDGDERGQSSLVYVPEKLVYEHASTIQDLFAEKQHAPGQFDPGDDICWDPKISKVQKPYKERSVCILPFIDYRAAEGDQDAIGLQHHRRKIWRLLLHWWMFVKDKQISPITCPWEKERVLKMARVLGADDAYVQGVKKCQTRKKIYKDEDEDLRWAALNHPG